MPVRDAKKRLESLRDLLSEGELSTQEELAEKLRRLDFEVTQSTISRDLRKLGAVKAIDTEGQTVYRLPEEFEPPVSGTITDLVLEIVTNGSMIVIHTAVGSASLVARHLDRLEKDLVLGTIAGDDTIFVAPANTDPKLLKQTMRAIRDAVTNLG